MRLEAVGKRYGLRQPWIVRDVTLAVPAGRLVRVEGPNGSGKSTLLRVVAGACVPSRGRVTGRPAAAYVPERFPPGLPLTPRFYLTQLGRVHGLRGVRLADRVEECLDRLGAAEYAERPMRTLSKGMCQKVAIAQALLPRPGLLVLDEAWTGLDEAARDTLDDEVAERLDGGGTVVFVDHDSRRLAGLVAERWRLAGGRVAVGGAEGGLPGAGPAAGADSGPPDAGTVLIELSGLSAAVAAGLAGRPGVLSVRSAGERTMLSTEAGASDSVLRALLAAGDAVHVRSVRPAGEARP